MYVLCTPASMLCPVPVHKSVVYFCCFIPVLLRTLRAHQYIRHSELSNKDEMGASQSLFVSKLTN